MQYTVKHTIDTNAESFWNKLFFNADFNRAMHLEVLGFAVYEVAEERTDENGVVHRRITGLPKAPLPPAARAMLGIDSLAFTEVGSYDPTTGVYSGEVTIDAIPDKLRTTVQISTEPIDGNSCERVAVIDNKVKVLGFGGMIEGVLQKQTRDSYARGALFTNTWIKEKGL